MQIEWLKCPSCGGTRKETGVGLRCMTCRGKGRLPLDPARYRDCEQCHGKGYLVWGDNPEDIEQTGDGAYRNIRDPQEPVNFALCWCCDGWGIVLRAGEAAKTTAGPPIRDLRKSFLMRRQSGDSCGARNCCASCNRQAGIGGRPLVRIPVDAFVPEKPQRRALLRCPDLNS